MSFNNKLDILFEDNSIIVCNKPAGVSSQTERGFDPDMVSLLNNYFSTNAAAYVGVIHRLDKPVCGVMVYAKTKKAAATLSKELSSSSFSKHYYSIVCLNTSNECTVKQEPTTLKNFLLHDVKSNSSKVVDKATPGAKEAVLEYKVIKTFSVDDLQFALLDINLITGRHHQIRVQLSYAGLPILGDKKYGISMDNLPFKLKRTGLALCAYSLSFTHPDTNKLMNYTIKPTHGIWATLF